MTGNQSYTENRFPDSLSGESKGSHLREITRIVPGGQNVAIFSSRRRWISQVSSYKTACTHPPLWEIIVLMVWLARIPLKMETAGAHGTVPSRSISMPVLKGQRRETLLTCGKQRAFQQSPLPVFRTAYIFTDVTEEFCSNLPVHNSVNPWHLHWKHHTWKMCDWGTNEVLSWAATSFMENTNPSEMA